MQYFLIKFQYVLETPNNLSCIKYKTFKYECGKDRKYGLVFFLLNNVNNTMK